MGKLPGGEFLCGVCFGSQPGFLDLGAIWHHTHPLQFYHTPKSTTSPLNMIIAVSQRYFWYQQQLRYHNGPVFWAVDGPIFKGHSKNHALFAIEKEGPHFGLGGRCDKESKYGAQGKERTIQFNGIAVLCCPSNKCLHALFRALASDKYDALKYMFMIMSNARNRMMASGFVARQSMSCLAFSIVFVVPFVCLITMELKAMRMVISTARA
jgi:hypothetical protein